MAERRSVSLDLKVEIIKAAESSKETQRDLAKKYGVSRTTVCVTLQRRKEILQEFEASGIIETSKNEFCEKSKPRVSKTGTCMFCKLGPENEEDIGKLYECDDVKIHYYCLLFSSGLEQNGKDEDGILGFLADDIRKEHVRSKKLMCCFCTKKGANVGCFSKKCKKSYHFNCGLKRAALFRFHTDFRSYCSSHRPIQSGPNVGEEVECPICFEGHVIDPKRSIWAPCCKPKSWFHRECVQKLALSAGYFFKCPLCNDKDIFVMSMRNWGVYVPEQDASWELEPNAFQDLLERPIHCDAKNCRCPTGRKTDDCGTRWEVLLCSLCGSTGIHVACGHLAFSCKEWHCTECITIVSESTKRQKQEERSKRAHSRSKTKEAEEMCIDNNEPVSLDRLKVNERISRKRRWSLELKKPCIKLPHLEDMACTRISVADDSEEEIDIESVESPVPPEASIQELEINGQSLPRPLEQMKAFIIQVKNEMHYLCLTSSNVLQIAQEWKTSDEVPITVDDITKFLNFELSYEKTLLVRSLLRHAFKKREEIISQALAKHADILTPRTTRRIVKSGTILRNLAIGSDSNVEKLETTPCSRGESIIKKTNELEEEFSPVTRGRRYVVLENPVESPEDKFTENHKILNPLEKQMDKENVETEVVACSSKSLSEERTVSCTSESISSRSYITMVIITSGVVDFCLNCFLAMDIKADHFFVTLSCGTVHIRCQHCSVWNIMLDVFRDQGSKKKYLQTSAREDSAAL